MRSTHAVRSLGKIGVKGIHMAPEDRESELEQFEQGKPEWDLDTLNAPWNKVQAKLYADKLMLPPAWHTRRAGW